MASRAHRTHRVLSGLWRARPAKTPAKHRARKARGKGAKAAGLRFEEAFGKAIAALHPITMDHPWFEFDDNYGYGYAQPDFVVPPAGAQAEVICFECKLGDVGGGESQLRELYLPILEHVYQRAPLGVVVARHLRSVPTGMRICSSLREALERARGGIVVLHWREDYPL